VHFTKWITADENLIDKKLEYDMKKAQDIIECALAARQEADVKLRWPIRKITVTPKEPLDIESVRDLILKMANAKELVIEDVEVTLVVKANFASMGPKFKGDANAIVKKFYTKLKDDINYTATFDLIYNGWEIASGAQRETNLETLTRRIKENNLKLQDYEDFLDIFRVGVPEHGGFCLGIERVIARLLELKSIEDVILFPRNPGKLRP